MLVTGWAGSGCCAGLAKLKRTSRWISVRDSEKALGKATLKGNRYSAHWSMWERGGGKERKCSLI